MGIETVLLVRPRRDRRAFLLEILRNAKAHFEEHVDAVLVHTFFPHRDLAVDVMGLRLTVAKLFGGELEALHDDPRGLLCYPDVVDSAGGETYADLVGRVGKRAVWLPVNPPAPDEIDAYVAAVVERETRRRARRS
jgi:hypothetical protein